MRPSEEDARGWYGPWWRWLIVAWVAWWGFEYGKMVVKQRGGKFQAVLVGCVKRTNCHVAGKTVIGASENLRSPARKRQVSW
jgi:hypothetical protein